MKQILATNGTVRIIMDTMNINGELRITINIFVVMGKYFLMDQFEVEDLQLWKWEDRDRMKLLKLLILVHIYFA